MGRFLADHSDPHLATTQGWIIDDRDGIVILILEGSLFCLHWTKDLLVELGHSCTRVLLPANLQFDLERALPWRVFLRRVYALQLSESWWVVNSD
jgi:hypothetical protein